VAATDLAGRVGQAAQLAPVPVDRAGPVDPVAPDPVGLAATDLAGPVARVGRAITAPADRAGPVDRATTGPAALVARVTTDPVDRVAPDSTDLVDRAVLERGTAMTTAATSTALRGETDPHPGVLASRRDRHGIGHFRRPVDRGTTVRSTTGATTKTRSGTKGSTSGASTSSEFGSRCKDSPHQTPASPIGEAGVAHLGVDYLPVTSGDPQLRTGSAGKTWPCGICRN
jgi:hypothetical protein